MFENRTRSECRTSTLTTTTEKTRLWSAATRILLYAVVVRKTSIVWTGNSIGFPARASHHDRRRVERQLSLMGAHGNFHFSWRFRLHYIVNDWWPKKIRRVNFTENERRINATQTTLGGLINGIVVPRRSGSGRFIKTSRQKGYGQKTIAEKTLPAMHSKTINNNPLDHPLGYPS